MTLSLFLFSTHYSLLVSCHLSTNYRLHLFQHLVERIVRFHEVGLGAEFRCLLDGVPGLDVRQHDDRNGGNSGVAPHLAENVQAVFFRQNEVEKYEIRPFALDGSKTRLAVKRRHHRIPLPPEEVPQGLLEGGLVFDGHYSFHKDDLDLRSHSNAMNQTDIR